MDFSMTQDIPAPVDAVDAALIDPAFLARMAELPKLGSATVLSQDRAGDVMHQQVRYLFQAELSSAVTRVVDPNKLTWVEDSECDLAAHHTRCVIRPDNYGDRLSGSYEAQLEEHEGGTRRVLTGRIKVKFPLVGGKVEKAIVSGLSENADAQSTILAEYLKGK